MTKNRAWVRKSVFLFSSLGLLCSSWTLGFQKQGIGTQIFGSEGLGSDAS